MKITIISVGKIKEKFFADAIEEYCKRLSRYCKLNTLEVADEKTDENSSRLEIELIQEKEAKRIAKHIPENVYLITLEIQGKELDSLELADKITQLGILLDILPQGLVGRGRGIRLHLVVVVEIGTRCGSQHRCCHHRDSYIFKFLHILYQSYWYTMGLQYLYLII